MLISDLFCISFPYAGFNLVCLKTLRGLKGCHREHTFSGADGPIACHLGNTCAPRTNDCLSSPDNSPKHPYIGRSHGCKTTSYIPYQRISWHQETDNPEGAAVYDRRGVLPADAQPPVNKVGGRRAPDPFGGGRRFTITSTSCHDVNSMLLKKLQRKRWCRYYSIY